MSQAATTLPIPIPKVARSIDHEHLTTLLGWLNGARSTRAAGRILEELQAYLSEHFVREEEPAGFFASVAEALPARARTIEQLRRDHRELLVDAQSTRDLVARSSSFDGTCSGRVARLITTLLEHEHRERELLDEASARETAAGPIAID